MPFNGSGTFNRLYSWVVDAANNINILSTKMDNEMNGFAAGLSNCVTRDGQSPPSADIPWGAKKITNLGNATTDTDALNRITGDGRYILASGAANLTLTGTLTAATLSISGNGTIGGTLGVTGVINAGGSVSTFDGGYFSTPFNGVTNTGLVRAGIQCDGTNQTLNFYTANVFRGSFNSSGNLSLSGSLSITGSATCTTPSTGDNSTTVATTAYVKSNLTSYAPLASPALTGTPTAPTAASGTATTQLATTAFVDPLRDVPSNAKTASYSLALTDRGGAVDFNGTTLTCTIPANASVAFPVGSTIVLTNVNSSALSIAITTDTLTLAGTTTTGTRTLAQNGMATLRKITSTSWLISGAGLS